MLRIRGLVQGEMSPLSVIPVNMGFDSSFSSGFKDTVQAWVKVGMDPSKPRGAQPQ